MNMKSTLSLAAATLLSIVALQAADWPQWQGPDRTGISNAYISQLETGQAKSPTPPILQKLAGLYETSYEDLLALAGYGGAFRPEVRDLFLSHRSTAKPFVRELAADYDGSADRRQLRLCTRPFE